MKKNKICEFSYLKRLDSRQIKVQILIERITHTSNKITFGINFYRNKKKTKSYFSFCHRG